MLYKERVAVCFQIHTKHTKISCGHNVGLLNVKVFVHIATNGH